MIFRYGSRHEAVLERPLNNNPRLVHRLHDIIPLRLVEACTETLRKLVWMPPHGKLLEGFFTPAEMLEDVTQFVFAWEGDLMQLVRSLCALFKPLPSRLTVCPNPSEISPCTA